MLSAFRQQRDSPLLPGDAPAEGLQHFRFFPALHHDEFPGLPVFGGGGFHPAPDNLRNIFFRQGPVQKFSDTSSVINCRNHLRLSFWFLACAGLFPDDFHAVRNAAFSQIVHAFWQYRYCAGVYRRGWNKQRFYGTHFFVNHVRKALFYFFCLQTCRC